MMPMFVEENSRRDGGQLMFYLGSYLATSVKRLHNKQKYCNN
jgi:hypothetical protein